MVAKVIEALAAFVTALPRILDMFDNAVGAFRRWKDERAEKALDKRQEEKRDAAVNLEKAENDKQRVKALRKLKRLG